MRGEMAILASAALFGSGATVVRILSEGMHPILIAAMFNLLSGGAVAAVYLSRGRTRTAIRPRRGDMHLLLGVALSGGIFAPIMFNLGVSMSLAATTALLMNAEVMFTIFLAYLLLKERMGMVEYAAMVVVLVLAVIISTDLDPGTVTLFGLGSMMVLLSAFGWGLDNTLSRILVSRVDIPFIFIFKTVVGGPVLLVISYAYGVLSLPGMDMIPLLVLGAIFTLGVSLLLFLYALKSIGAMRSATLFSTSTIIGAVVAFLVLGERISHVQAAAGLLMFATIALMLWARGRRSHAENGVTR